MNLSRLKSYFLGAAVIVIFLGCESTTDPLVGWKCIGNTGFTGGAYQTYVDKIPFEKIISNDVRDFVETLPIVRGKYADRSENYWIDEMSYFEDGKGQRAVKIHIPLDGTYQNYVLIYDKSGRRIKVKKFASGHYAC